MPKIVHFSIDDCQSILLHMIQDKQSSIWKIKRLNYLRVLHILFGVKVTMYVFWEFGEKYTLADVPSQYSGELSQASDWLQWGFHAVSPNQKKDYINPEFLTAFTSTRKEIIRFAGERALSRIIRLHYWFYPDEYLSVLKNYDVSTILLHHDDMHEYAGIDTCRTSIWIEHDGMYNALRCIWNNNKASSQELIIMTHEWAMKKSMMIKIFFICGLCKILGYKFKNSE